MNKIIYLAVLYCSFLCNTKFANAQFLSLNKTELKKLKTIVQEDSSAKKAFSLLEKQAKVALTQNPQPIDTIISEGHLATDPKKIKTLKALEDLKKIYALAYTYKITNNKEYFNKCVQYITAWATINQAIGNPINESKLDPLFEAYDLIKEEIKTADKQIIEEWFSKIAAAEIATQFTSLKRKSTYNNWNSHRIKILTNIAYLTNSKTYQLFVDSNFKKQIEKNLHADGSGMDFKERDALHYHQYTLEPLLTAATIIKRATGFDYYTYQSISSSSIQKSVEFLVPYAKGEKTHAEFVNSRAAFDRRRANNNEPGYKIGANYDPKNAIDVFIEASYFNKEFVEIVNTLAQNKSNYANWRCVLNAVKN
ncbi:alginate lyase family protein [Pedobacter alpinus]|uniref:Alginate lyase family protein n=1 Tax=Pedobacter alpinus TaxID=1590643 RepID=A0ABW5TNC9_9SPHI